MKTEKELNEDILEITMKIHQESPELSKYIEEMAVTIPNKEIVKIGNMQLENYYNSLLSLIEGYDKSNKANPIKKLQLIWQVEG